jgi:hypothetical protein
LIIKLGNWGLNIFFLNEPSGNMLASILIFFPLIDRSRLCVFNCKNFESYPFPVYLLQIFKVFIIRPISYTENLFMVIGSSLETLDRQPLRVAG